MLKDCSIILFFVFLTIYTMSKLKKNSFMQYFSMSQMIDPIADDVRLIGLITIYFPPLLYSFILSFFVDNIFESIIIYGFLTALFTVWPQLVYPKRMLRPQAYKKKNSLLILYGIYIFIYIFISIIGYDINLVVRNIQINPYYNFLEFLDFYKNLHIFYQNVMANLLVAAMLGILALMFRKLKMQIFKPT